MPRTNNTRRFKKTHRPQSGYKLAPYKLISRNYSWGARLTSMSSFSFIEYSSQGYINNHILTEFKEV